MKTEGPQIIPAEYLEKYQAALAEQMPDKTVRKRYPFRVPHMQSDSLGASAAQLYVREIFSRCVGCYNAQPDSGGVTPPTWGPRDRSWWFTDAIGSGLWYFDYFMQQSLDTYFGDNVPEWCKKEVTGDTKVNSQQPDTNFNSSSNIQAYNDGSVEIRAFVKNPLITLTAINLDIVAIDTGGLDPPYPIELEIYQVPDTWSESTLTWNNKPALGKLLLKITLESTPAYQRINIGENISAFCIKRVGGVWGYSWGSERAFPQNRPFYST